MGDTTRDLRPLDGKVLLARINSSRLLARLARLGDSSASMASSSSSSLSNVGTRGRKRFALLFLSLTGIREREPAAGVNCASFGLASRSGIARALASNGSSEGAIWRGRFGGNRERSLKYLSTSRSERAAFNAGCSSDSATRISRFASSLATFKFGLRTGPMDGDGCDVAVPDSFLNSSSVTK